MCDNGRKILDRPAAAEFLTISVRKLDYLCAKGLVPYCRVPAEKGANGKKVFLRSRLLETVVSWEVR